MRRALRRTAEAVLSSSATVVVAVLTLLLCSFPTTRGLGVASAVGIAVAATCVLLILPAALVLCGRWVFWPLVPRVGQTTLVDGRSFWGRVGRGVARAPVALITAATIVLAGMALGVTQVETGLSTSEQFLEEPEAIRLRIGSPSPSPPAARTRPSWSPRRTPPTYAGPSAPSRTSHPAR